MIEDMQLIMNDERLQTIEQVRQFLQGSETLEFGGISIEERYHWIETGLVRFKYSQLWRSDRGVIRRYIEKVSGYLLPISTICAGATFIGA